MKALNFKYVPVILFLFLAQVLFSLNAHNQIRYEELSESVRNVWWLQNNQVFSGINSHLGWYTPLKIVYNIFGFSFEYIKYLRLFLHLISIVCLALLLKNILVFKKSLVPLITIALSPTLLFFNSLSTHYGVDMQYLPIILYLLTKISFRRDTLSLIPHILVWSLSMIAWAAYPTFLYYLPAITIFYIYKLFKEEDKGIIRTRYLFISLISFLLPIVLMVLQIQNKQILILDPNTGGGLFRGPGRLATLAEGIERIYHTFLGFAGFSESYYYEVSKKDFADFYPVLSILVSIFLGIKLALKNKQVRFFASLITLTAVVNLFVLALIWDDSGPSSVRRATGLLAVFYAFYILGWYALFRLNFTTRIRYLLILILLLLPLHHLLVLPVNIIHLQDKSPYREQVWLSRVENSPGASLKSYIEMVRREDLKLYVSYPKDAEFGYVYNWIYSAVSGYCYWNKINCHKIYGFDLGKGGFVELNLESVNYTHK